MLNVLVTVLLNADRRDWGIWLASGGLLLGGAFFISHTAILSDGLFGPPARPSLVSRNGGGASHC